MTIHEELNALRSAMDSAIKRIESLEKANADRIAEIEPQADSTEAQAVYTAIMTDTLAEV